MRINTAEFVAPENLKDFSALFPGVRVPQSEVHVGSAQEAAELVADEAAQAAKAGTFGVGGVMLEKGTGRVLAVAQNRVLIDGKLHDHTAHAERQLLDWYAAAKGENPKLPKPDDVVIVSSLEPCVMCAGACLQHGIDVAYVAPDRFAGISHSNEGEFDAAFPTLPPAVREKAKRHLTALAIEGGRSYHGLENGPFADQAVSEKVAWRALRTFEDTVAKTCNFINHVGDGTEPINPAELAQDHPVRRALRELYPKALTVTCADGGPDEQLAPLLCEAAEEAGKAKHARNAVALLDPHGNVLLVMGGKEGEGGTKSALMQAARAYTRLRNQATPDILPYLPHPKHCHWVSLYGPGQDAASVADLGSFGSLMEGPLSQDNPHPLQYVLPLQNEQELAAMVGALPQLYSGLITLSPQRCGKEALHVACERWEEPMIRPDLPSFSAFISGAAGQATDAPPVP